MITVDVQIPGQPYPVRIGRDLLASAGRWLPQSLRGRRCAVIADARVAELHAARLRAGLEGAVDLADILRFPAGESSKSMTVAAGLCEALSRAGIDRSGFLLALGGGVAGDLAGFVAAIHLRGIPYVQCPTTIVAQVDSSVGGKTGVNSGAGKNLIGCFHHPRAVLADTGTLDTLPPREFREGLAEVVKHALLRAPGLLDRLDPLDPADLPDLVAENVRIKAGIVAGDPEERTGLRALLNLGHTLGHAIEGVAGYGHYLHGEAVALGLVAALRLSTRLAGLEPAFARRVVRLLHGLGLPVQIPADLPSDALLAAAGHDKKFVGGRIRFVLLHAPGDARVSEAVTSRDMLDAIEALRRPAPELA